jgi:hypothetical protein
MFPRWMYTAFWGVGVAFGLVVIAMGHVPLGLFGLAGSLGYAVLFPRWDESNTPPMAHEEESSMRLRWPRYSEHPLLQRVRLVATVLGAAVFLTILITAITLGRF